MKQIKIVVFMLFVIAAQGQQDAQFTHYMYNQNTVNPAFAGSRDVFSAVLIHRTQWINSIEGAPRTQSLSIHTPLRNPMLGVGFNMVNDKIGPLNKTQANIDFSYSIDLEGYNKMSFGLKGGVSMLNLNYNELRIRDINDPFLETELNNKIIPQIGFGFLYQAENGYLGLGSPNLLETKHVDTNISSSSFNSTERIHAYLNAGYNFDLNHNLKFQPTTQLKAVMGSPLQVDVTAMFLVNDKFKIGAGYRLDSSFSGLLSIKVLDNLLVGAAYDYDLNDFSTISSGSYEVFLRYELSRLSNSSRNKRILHPRYF